LEYFIIASNQKKHLENSASLGNLNFPILDLNIFLAALMLLLTSYLDMKKREVPDKVWIIFGAIGVILQIYEVEFSITKLFYLILAIVLSAVIGMGIFFAGLYGGADGKALIVLAVLFPFVNPHVGVYPVAPLIVLTNGILLSMLLPLSLFFLNIVRIIRGRDIFEGFSEPLHRKILAAFLGYKSKGKPRDFQFSMEKKEENQEGGGGKKFDFSLMQEEFETSPGTWVTPGIPLLVFFTAGFFVLLFYGDLVISVIRFIAQSI
jgi:preflagellin peptidase FlaK